MNDAFYLIVEKIKLNKQLLHNLFDELLEDRNFIYTVNNFPLNLIEEKKLFLSIFFVKYKNLSPLELELLLSNKNLFSKKTFNEILIKNNLFQECSNFTTSDFLKQCESLINNNNLDVLDSFIKENLDLLKKAKDKNLWGYKKLFLKIKNLNTPARLLTILDPEEDDLASIIDSTFLSKTILTDDFKYLIELSKTKNFTENLINYNLERILSSRIPIVQNPENVIPNLNLFFDFFKSSLFKGISKEKFFENIKKELALSIEDIKKEEINSEITRVQLNFNEPKTTKKMKI